VAVIAFVLATLVSWISPAAHAADVQPGYEFSGSPKAEFLIDDLRNYVGRSFWIRRPLQDQLPIALFCHSDAAPSGKDCPGEKTSVNSTARFTVEDVIVAQPQAEWSWLKIRFANDNQNAYLSLQDFTRHRYNEARVAAEPVGIDYALANSGWIFDDFPPKILDQRRAHFKAQNDPKLAQQKFENERITRLRLLHPGMSAQQVLNSSWGPPNAVSSNVHGWRRLEQWNYGGGIVLYFENDRLQRIESHRW
jgi:hypothetical protein